MTYKHRYDRHPDVPPLKRGGSTERMLANDKRVLDMAFDEPGRVIITTAYGYAFEPNPDERVAEHVRGFDLWEQARNVVRQQARPCECQRCKTHDGKVIP